MELVHADARNWDDIVVRSNIPVVVDFWATWCGPCRMQTPVLEGLAEELAGEVLFVKVDVDENQALAAKFGIMSIPTLMVVNNGVIAARRTGLTSREGVLAMLQPVRVG